MKEINLHDNPDDLFRKGMENLPEETPSLQEWEQMQELLKTKGIISQKRNRKKFFILFSLAASVIVFISLFFFIRNGNIPSKHSEKENAIAQDGKQQNKTLAENHSSSAENHVGHLSEVSEKQKPPGSGSKQIIPKEIYREAKNPVQKPIISKVNSTNKNNFAEISSETSQAKQNPLQALSTNEDVEKKSAKTVSSLLAETPVLPENHLAQNIIPEIKDSTLRQSSKKDSVQVQVRTSAIVNNDTLVVAQQKNNDENNSSQKKAKTIWLGGYFSWDINNYELEDTKNTSHGDYVMNTLKADSLGKQFQFTVGLTGGYGLSEHFSAEGGIFYSQKKQVKKSIGVPKYNTEYGESIVDYSYYYNAQYLELYGGLKYYLSKGKVNYYIAPGLLGSFNFPVKEEKRGYFTRTFYSETTQPKSEKIILEPHSFGMSAVFSAGAEIKLTPKWNIYAEPSYKYGLNPVIKHPTYNKVPVNHFWRTVGFGIGCMYNF